jgi:hypothetical protein
MPQIAFSVNTPLLVFFGSKSLLFLPIILKKHKNYEIFKYFQHSFSLSKSIFLGYYNNNQPSMENLYKKILILFLFIFWNFNAIY